VKYAPSILSFSFSFFLFCVCIQEHSGKVFDTSEIIIEVHSSHTGQRRIEPATLNGFNTVY
jgi:hypothetical protein